MDEPRARRREGRDGTVAWDIQALHITLIKLHKGTNLNRVHLCKYRANEFNPGVAGNARFSPIQDERCNAVPTLYAGTTLECALMETIFHDVPFSAGFKFLDSAKLAGQVHSVIRIEAELQIIDLSSIALRKLGVTRSQLIETEKDCYHETRAFAREVRRHCPHAQGLSWVSRQDDTARALVLFGDRINAADIHTSGESNSLTEHASTYDAVLDLAQRAGVVIVPGNANPNS